MYGCSIVLTHRLQQYPISKTDYVAVLKPYVKAVYQKLVDDKKTDRAAIFKAGMPAAIKKLKAMWVDLLPYKGDSSDENGMVCFMNYRESGDPYMIFFKDGIREEKVVSTGISTVAPYSTHLTLMYCNTAVRVLALVVVHNY